MFDWGLFTDYHEAIPHLAFEAMTVAVPAVFGWVLGHRRHDAKRHPGKDRLDARWVVQDGNNKRYRRTLSDVTQRIEALEARSGEARAAQVWDASGERGM